MRFIRLLSSIYILLIVMSFNNSLISMCTPGVLFDRTNYGGSGPYAVDYSPITSSGNLFLAATNSGAANIAIYQVNQITGTLTAVTGSPFASGTAPFGVAFSPITTEGDIFLATANATDGTSSVYQVDQNTGVLTPIQTPSITAGSNNLWKVAYSPITPGGQMFIAFAISQVDTSKVYQVDTSTGLIGTSAVSTFNNGCYSAAFSPITLSGNLFLASTDTNADAIHIYSVNTTTGALTEVTGSPYSSGATGASYPVSVAFSPLDTSGNLVLSVVNFGGQGVTYVVNPSTGALSNQLSLTGLSSPQSVTYSPYVSSTGEVFAAIANAGSSNIFTYSVNMTTGAFTNITGSPFSIGTTDLPYSVSYSPLTSYGTMFLASANYSFTGSGSVSNFNVQLNPVVTVTPNPASTCVGTGISLTATVTGGDSPYTYSWTGPNGYTSISNPAVINSPTSSSSGTYTVVVTDSGSCQGTNSTVLTVNANPTATLSGTSPICLGSSSTLTLTLTGTSPYDVTWSDGVTQTGVTSPVTRVVSPTTTTTYSATVIDANGCSGTSNNFQVIVDEVTATLSGTSPICLGSSSTLTLTLTGTSPYDVTWSDGVTQTGVTSPVTRVVSPTTTTTYSATVIDANGCSGTSNSFQVIVDEVAATLSGTSPICLGSSSTLTLTLTGASPYDVTWSDGVTQTAVTSPVTRVVSPTTTTTYSATVIDANGCSGTSNSFQVIVNNNPTVSITPNPASVCVGSNITLTATPLGGSGTYTNYAWALNGSSVGTNSPTLQISNATLSDAGTYQVTVTDSNGCQAIATTTVSVGEVIVSANSSPSTVCSGNSSTLTAVVTSGLAPYTYQWTGPNAFTSTINPVTISNTTSLNAGIYQVTVTDSNGCQGTATTTIVVDTINVNITGSNTVCLGSTINLASNVTTGVAPYTYQWTGPNGFTSTSASISIPNAQQVNSGAYTVTVTDSNGCQGVASSLVTVDIVSVNVVPSTATACVGSNVTLTANVTSGTSPYSYGWVGPNGYTSTGNPITISNISLSNSGTYSVIVTDSNNCTGMSSSVVNVNQLSVSVSPSLESVCVGSTITLTANVSGGTAPYSYQWTGPNGLTSTVNPLVINNATLSNAGLYQVTVTDTNNCSGSSSSVVNVGQLGVSIVPASQSICVDGTIDLFSNVSGGTEPYSYQWQGPNGFTSNTQNVTINNATLSNTGTYQLTVTDINGCSGISSATVNVGQLNVLVSPEIEAVCIGSTITLTANSTGGVAPYTYQWSGPNGFISTSNPAIINNATLLNAGTYHVVVIDANSCSGSGSSNINVDQVIVSVSPSNTSVCPGSTVVLTANVTTGVAPYTYQWSGPNGYSFTGNPAVISGISIANQGVYTVTVTDGNGCSGISTATVEIGELEVQVSPDLLSTCLGATINFTSSVSGGTLPYTYQWTGPNGFTSNNPNVTISNASELNAGTYQLEVTDVNGCSSLGFATVTINAVNVNIISDSNFFNLVNANAVQNTCQGTTITLTAQVTSGNPPFTYQWTGPNGFSSTEQTINIPNAQPVNSGTYRVVVTSCDMSGEVCCTAQSSVDVVVSNISVTVIPSSTSVCPGSTVTLSTNVTGGSAPYTYSWAGPNGFTANTQNITINNVSELTSGMYQVTVTDSNGCASIGSSQINLEDIVIEIIPNPAVVSPNSSITLRANIVCGQGPFIYQWTGPNGFTSNNPIITINNANGLNTGTYTLTVTDANGNTITETIEIRLDDLSVDIISNTLNVRQGQTIVLTAQVSGGQSPYTYQWFGPAVTRSTSGQLISTDQTLVVDDATTENSGIYTVIVTDAYGFTASDSVNVTVRATSSLSSAIASKYCS